MKNEPTAAKPQLSKRERQIVLRLLKGDLQTTIASDLDISTRVVQTYVQRAKAKFQCQTLFQLAFRYVSTKKA